jgi:glycosyltransferase involved in cell wall biosynthesis
LTAARQLLRLYPFARFVVVGDGPLRESLQDLAGRLGISDRVTFTGWVGSEVPLVLRGLDVMVNPSLRGWSETFCVANIEAMSMQVPLVTFAVGGELLLSLRICSFTVVLVQVWGSTY